MQYDRTDIFDLKTKSSCPFGSKMKAGYLPRPIEHGRGKYLPSIILLSKMKK